MMLKQSIRVSAGVSRQLIPTLKTRKRGLPGQQDTVVGTVALPWVWTRVSVSLPRCLSLYFAPFAHFYSLFSVLTSAIVLRAACSKQAVFIFVGL